MGELDWVTDVDISSGSDFDLAEDFEGGERALQEEMLTDGPSAAASAPTSTNAGGGHRGDHFSNLSVYSGSRKKGAYKQWRREVNVFLLAYSVPSEQIGPRLWLRLAGEARDAVEQLDLEKDLAVEGGHKTLLAILDSVFDQEECDVIDDAVNEFWNCRREAGQSMETYITNLKTAMVRMRKEDPETRISNKAFGVIMLKRAGLTAQERQQVLSATNATYDADRIETALKRLFKDVAVTDRYSNRPVSRSKSKGKGKSKRSPERVRGRGKGTFVAESMDDDDEDEEEDAYWEDEDDSEDDDDDYVEEEEDDGDDDDDDDERDPDMEEATAAFQTARRKLAMAKKKQQRGYQKGGKGAKKPKLEEKKAK